VKLLNSACWRRRGSANGSGYAKYGETQHIAYDAVNAKCKGTSATLLGITSDTDRTLLTTSAFWTIFGGLFRRRFESERYTGRQDNRFNKSWMNNWTYTSTVTPDPAFNEGNVYASPRYVYHMAARALFGMEVHHGRHRTRDSRGCTECRSHIFLPTSFACAAEQILCW
jgi:hypothetical protein